MPGMICRDDIRTHSSRTNRTGEAGPGSPAPQTRRVVSIRRLTALLVLVTSAVSFAGQAVGGTALARLLDVGSAERHDAVLTASGSELPGFSGGASLRVVRSADDDRTPDPGPAPDVHCCHAHARPLPEEGSVVLRPGIRPAGSPGEPPVWTGLTEREPPTDPPRA